MKRKNLQTKRIKPELPGGFRDYGPEEAIIKQKIIVKLKKTFEDFGFDPMETPDVERTEILTGGEKESQKIIFNIRGSKEKKSDMSLRFDLTVPLARFLAAHPEIEKPFKRYQIGNVYRGESPQAGRFREFMQADIDIVGASSPDADSEIIAAMYQSFKNLGINRFIININNRKILNGISDFAGFPEKKLWDVLRAIDKTDKIGKEGVEKELKKIVPKKTLEKINMFLGISGDTKEKILKAREMFKGIAVAEEGIGELIEIARNCNAAGLDQRNWQINFSTVRGLGYYTGTVFETFLPALPEIGSIFSGGRYDTLMMPFTGQKIPAVGASLGIDRLFAALEKLGLLKKKSTKARVFILNLSPDLKSDYFGIAQKLRNANINTSLYLGDDHAFQAQFAYAVKIGVPFVVIFGEEEKKKGKVIIKNLATRTQNEVPMDHIVGYFKK